MDVLADIFETIQLRGSFYFRTDFSPPWGTTVPARGRAARFHYVVQGSCWIRVGDAAPVALTAGDFVLVPNGASHILSYEEIADAPPLETVLEAAGYKGEVVLAIGHGDPAAATQLICGHLSFGEGADHAVLRALPSLVRITDDNRARRPWLNHVLQLLVEQVFNNNPGSISAVTRLTEIVFIEAIRFVGDEAPELQRLMEAFSDVRIGRAIASIHSDPARPWTVDSLAQEAGMSRTRFAKRFQEMVGIGPISYLTEWRLQRAVAAVTTTKRPIGVIAHTCGYASPAAFTRAFAERFGRTPNQFRTPADARAS